MCDFVFGYLFLSTEKTECCTAGEKCMRMLAWPSEVNFVFLNSAIMLRLPAGG